MIFRSFYIQVSIRIILLILLIFCFLFTLLETDWVATTILTALLIPVVVYSLFFYVTKTNRDLNSFLKAVKHDDFSASFGSYKKGKSFEELSTAFNEVIQEFKRLRAEKESHYQYLHNVVEHVGVALISFNKDGEVHLMNKAANNLLHKSYIKNIDALQHLDKRLYEVINRLKSGQRELIRLQINSRVMQVAVHVTEFKLQGEEFKLVSLQNIKGELDNKELDAWQKLIRVLTHEIMNSVTPITSLTSVINEMLVDEEGNLKKLDQLEPEAVEDIHLGLQSIEKRSNGLMGFVKAYRNFTQVAVPNMQKVNVQDLLARIYTLLKAELKNKKIEFVLDAIDDLYIQADPELLEQVLINLIINAKDALPGKEPPRIELSALRGRSGKVMIQVKDTGIGIEEDLLNEIFVPFYTDKESGSGIGLSLSRQIMRLHEGSIHAQSKKWEGSIFTLEFP